MASFALPKIAKLCIAIPETFWFVLNEDTLLTSEFNDSQTLLPEFFSLLFAHLSYIYSLVNEVVHFCNELP